MVYSSLGYQPPVVGTGLALRWGSEECIPACVSGQGGGTCTALGGGRSWLLGGCHHAGCREVRQGLRCWPCLLEEKLLSLRSDGKGHDQPFAEMRRSRSCPWPCSLPGQGTSCTQQPQALLSLPQGWGAQPLLHYPSPCPEAALVVFGTSQIGERQNGTERVWEPPFSTSEEGKQGQKPWEVFV